jgi:hypothetical protein
MVLMVLNEWFRRLIMSNSHETEKQWEWDADLWGIGIKLRNGIARAVVRCPVSSGLS